MKLTDNLHLITAVLENSPLMQYARSHDGNMQSVSSVLTLVYDSNQSVFPVHKLYSNPHSLNKYLLKCLVELVFLWKHLNTDNKYANSQSSCQNTPTKQSLNGFYASHMLESEYYFQPYITSSQHPSIRQWL